MDWWGRDGQRPAGDTGYTGHKAFAEAAVIAAVGWRAGVFAQIPFHAYRDGADGMSVRAPRQPMLLENPSPRSVPSVWRIQMSISRDLWGYALGVIAATDGGGWPTQVEWLPPWEVKV